MPIIAFIIACSGGNDSNSSSEAQITQLSVTINGKDYDVSFVNNAAAVAIPSNQTIPQTITVKSAALSAGASGPDGLAAGQPLTLTDGSVRLTITAGDGIATTDYTITVAHLISAAELARSDTTVDGSKPDAYRINYGAFSIETTAAGAGDYRLAVRAASKTAPNAAEIPKLLPPSSETCHPPLSMCS